MYEVKGSEHHDVFPLLTIFFLFFFRNYILNYIQNPYCVFSGIVQSKSCVMWLHVPRGSSAGLAWLHRERGCGGGFPLNIFQWADLSALCNHSCIEPCLFPGFFASVNISVQTQGAASLLILRYMRSFINFQSGQMQKFNTIPVFVSQSL